MKPMDKIISARGRFLLVAKALSMLAMLMVGINSKWSTPSVQAQEMTHQLVELDNKSLSGEGSGEFLPFEPQSGNLMAREHEYYISTDEVYGVGLWESKPGTMAEDGLEYDELMYILDGAFTIKDGSGATQTFSAGEGFVMAKGWKGTLEVPEGGVRMLWSMHTTGGSENEPQKIIPLDNERLAGGNLGEYSPYEPEIGNLMARGHDYFYSNGANFGVGIWESEPGAQTYESLGYDELMYVLEGSLTMTDKSGNSQTFGAGEGVVLPKGYSGTLSVPEGGVRKIWTSYMAGEKG